MDHELLYDPIKERVYYLFDSYTFEMHRSNEQRIFELQKKLNDKLESDGYLSFNDYMEIIMEDWPEEEKFKFRMRQLNPDYAREYGWTHKVGEIEYAFLQVRNTIADGEKTIIMLEPFPIPKIGD